MFITLSFIAALCFTTGGLFMKSADGLTKLGPSILCLSCFVAGAALQALAMRGNQMSVTHIFVLGLEAALALLLGWSFFQEALSLPKLFGTALIVAGMILIRRG